MIFTYHFTAHINLLEIYTSTLRVDHQEASETSIAEISDTPTQKFLTKFHNSIKYGNSENMI